MSDDVACDVVVPDKERFKVSMKRSPMKICWSDVRSDVICDTMRLLDAVFPEEEFNIGLRAISSIADA